MSVLSLSGRQLASGFELLGSDENALTKSLGLALYRSPTFLRAFIREIGIEENDTDWNVRLQGYGEDRGFTDVELESTRVHVIIEAKRGWLVPSTEQLARYGPRLGPASKTRQLVTLSECSPEFVSAQVRLPQNLEGVPIVHCSWQRILEVACQARAGTRGSEAVWMREFLTYLERVIRVQRQDSNLVYCVSLGADTPSGWGISWRDIVEKKGRYFHPLAKNWPVEPPNYLAFRYDGKLRSIHHVERCEMVTQMHSYFAEIPKGEWPPHILYSLGPAIRPPREVKNGRVYPSGRIWCALDLLLTSSTVSEARDLTKARLGQEEARRLATSEGSGEG